MGGGAAPAPTALFPAQAATRALPPPPAPVTPLSVQAQASARMTQTGRGGTILQQGGLSDRLGG